MAPLPRETTWEWIGNVTRSVELGVHVGHLSAASSRQLEGESLGETVKAGSAIRNQPLEWVGEEEPAKERRRPENEEGTKARAGLTKPREGGTGDQGRLQL